MTATKQVFTAVPEDRDRREAREPAAYRIGISGWRYRPWRGVFYPPDLPQKNELFFASRKFNTIEINGTFYALQSPYSFKHWYRETPEDFLFSVKGSRFITHIRRLKDAGPALANFFASGILHLKEKLGPFLWQLPPNFLYDEDRIARFLEILPRNWGEAMDLSLDADRIQADFPKTARREKRLRHALEIRHPSFENPDFIDLLRRFDIALVFADTAGKWPYIEEVTSDFVYLRLHGNAEIYESDYDDVTLKWWARRLRRWCQGQEPEDTYKITDLPTEQKKRTAYVYFDNDVKVRAPFNASRLASILAGAASPITGFDQPERQAG